MEDIELVPLEELKEQWMAEQAIHSPMMESDEDDMQETDDENNDRNLESDKVLQR